MSTVIRVPSLTDPHLVYDVVRDGETRTCTHPFFRPGERCKHMSVADAVETLLARCVEHHAGDGQRACADCIAALFSAAAGKVKRAYVSKVALKEKQVERRETNRTNAEALKDFRVGDRVEYILPRAPSNGRTTTWYLPATVEKISATRLVIRIDKYPDRTRATLPSCVRKMEVAK